LPERIFPLFVNVLLLISKVSFATNLFVLFILSEFICAFLSATISPAFSIFLEFNFVRSTKSSIDKNSPFFLALTIESAALSPNPSIAANGGIKVLVFSSTAQADAFDLYKSGFVTLNPLAYNSCVISKMGINCESLVVKSGSFLSCIVLLRVSIQFLLFQNVF